MKKSAEAFSLVHPDIEIEWKVRSLQQFEHQPFAKAVASADLVVFDHPYCGTIMRDNLLWPVDDLLSEVAGGLDPERYIGPSLQSYQTGGRTWAVPVDGATVHSIYREDLFGKLSVDLPENWSEVMTVAKAASRAGLKVIIAARGHHAFLTVVSLMANLGGIWEKDRALDAPALSEALDLYDRLLDVTDRELCLTLNAIDVHERLASSPDAAYCPASYGYATYGEAVGAHVVRLRFADFPGPLGASGAVLGGAGVGISRVCSNLETARSYLAYLGQPDVQRSFSHSSGQPARIESWLEPATDSRFNGFYSAVTRTMEQSSIRPRAAGYAAVEQNLSSVVTKFLQGSMQRAAAVRSMQEIWRRFL
ncbi:ABC transporter substrate-binding protein [Rhizobium sp. 18055]|uniref:ABC transporter substrate-binding protein n=1 Tax=Rhizobium sp. 18055 TaxID=2681403 RepID=UPI00135A9D93|nr:ABC transporter substrate-binding protein [Rhizobium sp. 18055]